VLRGEAIRAASNFLDEAMTANVPFFAPARSPRAPLGAQATSTHRPAAMHGHRARRTRAAAALLTARDSNGADMPKKVVIVGAGWAGFGAAKHLAEQGAGSDPLSILAITEEAVSEQASSVRR
jgi:NADPH-dependent 2,4-dienoyl-CoA reductase/sulfur reductase-like enzyme